MRFKGVCLIAVLAAVSLCGCSKKYEEAIVPDPAVETSSETKRAEMTTAAVEEPETEPDERIEVNGKIRSYLTGEMTDVSKANRRPLAVMMSNDKQALPQYGINRAGVVYEAPVEGGMNRYMAILEDYDDLERIGSVRSCRTYYTYFAREFDAIYSHFGQSTFAKPYLKNLDDIDGLAGAGADSFFRSKDRKSPHNAYTSFALAQTAIGKLGFSQEYNPGYLGHYQFAKAGQEVKLEQGEPAYKVVPGYQMNKPWFEYHEDDGLYYRFQYGKEHKGDMGQIAVKNIIIQYCQSGYYATTEYINFNVHTSESGYYITNGKVIPVRWKKAGEFGPTRYYNSEGQEITLNKGKTWVCILSTSQTSKAEFYGKE